MSDELFWNHLFQYSMCTVTVNHFLCRRFLLITIPSILSFLFHTLFQTYFLSMSTIFFVISSTTLWFWVFNSLIIPYNVFWTYSKFFLNSFHIYPLPSRPIFVSLFINPLDHILLDNGWVKLCILWKWGQALFFYLCI